MAEHAAEALHYLDEARRSVTNVEYYLAVAQVHATLEVAAAVRSLKSMEEPNG
jgi:hypothetical protein